MDQRPGGTQKEMGDVTSPSGGGLYVHIPFCKQACHYCNFHFSTNATYREQMVAALLREMELRADFFRGMPLSSLYFGGGTPSILEPVQLESLCERAGAVFGLLPGAEITLEANPDDMDRDKLRFLRDHTPVNRLSIGIQSFYREDLEYMNRVHSAGEAHRSIENALTTGFASLTVDLIYGQPSLTDEHWKKNLATVFDYGIPHLSCYNLTVEERTALYHMITKGKCAAPLEEDGLRQFGLLMDALDEHGYLHYEISNAAQKEQHIARHNSAYWRDRRYLGIGPSAHSYDGTRRMWNIAHNHKYMQGLSEGRIPAEEELLTQSERYNEWVMTGLRTVWGLEEEVLQSYDEKFRSEFEKGAQRFLDMGYLLRENGRYRLTRSGKFIADRIASDLMVVNE